MRASDVATAGADLDAARCVAAFETELAFVYRALRRQGVRPGDLDDLAQEVFLILWRRWRQLDRSRPLRPWLFGVIVKVAQSYRRRESRLVPWGLVEREDTRRSADEQLDGARARALVSSALARLSDKQRVVVVMHDLEARPMGEIAAGLKVPLFTAYTRLRDGRRALAAAIDRGPTTTAKRRRVLVPLAVWLSGAAAAALIALVALRRASPPVPAHPAPSLARGLIGAWRFDDPRGAFADRSGGGNDCSLRSTDPGARGRSVESPHGRALMMDGTSWLECPRVDRLDQLGTEITIALWLKPEDLGTRQVLVTRQLSSSGDRVFSLRLQDGQLEFLSHVWKALLRRPYPVTGWSHLVAVRAASETRLYVNGALVGRNRRPVPAALGGGGGALTLGGQVNGPEPATAQDRFRGSLEELLIYGRALSDAEIALLAAGVHPAAAR